MTYALTFVFVLACRSVQSMAWQWWSEPWWRGRDSGRKSALPTRWSRPWKSRQRRQSLRRWRHPGAPCCPGPAKSVCPHGPGSRTVCAPELFWDKGFFVKMQDMSCQIIHPHLDRCQSRKQICPSQILLVPEFWYHLLYDLSNFCLGKMSPLT